MTIKLTLDVKYKVFVESIRRLSIPNIGSIIDDSHIILDRLSFDWYGNCNDYESKVKVIERIHSADEIEWIEPECMWKLKGNKVYTKWLSVLDDSMLYFTARKDGADRFTESDLKDALKGTGLPFDAFEKVNANE